MAQPLVGIIMGSSSDWETMRHAAETLDKLGVAHETKVVSAHRTPKRLYDYASSAKERGLKIIIAGAGGAAHLPGMAASMTSLPVLGVPVESQARKGMDSLLSIVQMRPEFPSAPSRSDAQERSMRGFSRRRSSRLPTTSSPPASSAIAKSKPNRWLKRRNDFARVDHRYRRRRPARPDARDGRGPARLQMPHL